ncbi:putative glycoside hydrolase [Fusibacter bizertensis]
MKHLWGWKMIRQFCSILLIVCAMTILSSCDENKTSSPFPRLGMWWLDAYHSSPKEIAKYDLLLQEFDNDEFLKEQFDAIAAINPKQVNLKPLSPSERQLFLQDWETGEVFPNPEISKLPTDFFLMQTGAQLIEPIDKTTTTLKLDRVKDNSDWPLFHLGGEVAIGDYESAKIISIDWENNIIEVQRGYVREASAHDKDEKVASHIRFWPGSWVMNVTAACPRITIEGLEQPVNYIGYYFSLITGKLNSIYRRISDNYNLISADIDYDGFVIDRFEDKESWLKWVNDDQEIALDLYHDFSQITVEEFDESWKQGTDQLTQLLKKAYPKALIIRNNPLTVNIGIYDGQVYETGGWENPSNNWWKQLIVERAPENYYSEMPYLKWFENIGKENAIVLFEVYDDESSPDENSDGIYNNPYLDDNFIPNYQKMRFSLTTALLGDGYYSYEINTNGHGSLGLMWFDEYDNAGEGTGYLGLPTGKPMAVESGAYLRNFENGLVLVNPTDKVVQIDLPKSYYKIKGNQVPSVNTGELVDQVNLDAFDGIILLSHN